MVQFSCKIFETSFASVSKNVYILCLQVRLLTVLLARFQTQFVPPASQAQERGTGLSLSTDFLTQAGLELTVSCFLACGLSPTLSRVLESLGLTVLMFSARQPKETFVVCTGGPENRPLSCPFLHLPMTYSSSFLSWQMSPQMEAEEGEFQLQQQQVSHITFVPMLDPRPPLGIPDDPLSQALCPISLLPCLPNHHVPLSRLAGWQLCHRPSRGC